MFCAILASWNVKLPEMALCMEVGQTPFTGSSDIVIFVLLLFSSPEPKAPGELIV